MRRCALHALLLFFLSFLPLSLSQLSATDGAAMAAIARAINNQTFKWNTSHPDPCMWSGVFCSQKAITTLSLTSFQLSSSSFLPLLCKLDTLRHLNLSNNQLPSIPPAFFANCSAAATLQSLNFSSNMLRGNLPTFAGFSALESLDLSGNRLEGGVTTQLNGLAALRGLNLSGNRFVGAVPTRLGTGMLLEELQLSRNSFVGAIPDDVGDYRNLTLIDLSSNILTGRIPDRLSELPKLEILVLSSNFLEGAIPPGLSRIATLSRFAANENGLSGSIPAEISNHVKYLDLSYNNLTGLIPPNLLSGRNLVFVDLSANALEGPVPVDMSPSLFRLRLGQNHLNGSIPSSIGNLSELMYFEVDSNELSGEIPAELAECEKLSLLDLRGNRLQGRIPNGIGNLTQLVVLRLDGNRLNGEIPSEFSQLKNLSILSLGRNSLTGGIPRAITKLTKLSNLNLESNQLSGQIPDGFVSMNALLEVQLGANLLNGTIPRMPETLQIALNLSKNHFEGPLPLNLNSLVNLEILDLSDNRFSGEIPYSLTQLKSLTQLDLSNNQFSGTVPSFRTNMIVNTDGNAVTVRTTKSAEAARKRKNVATVVIVVIVAVGAVAAMVTLAAIFIISRRFYRVNDEMSELEEAGPQVINGHMITTESIHRIDFAKAIEAAGNPANAMYKSRFSTYYKAVMPSGITYCIKKLNWSDKIFQLGSHERFGQEVEALGRLNNSRIMAPIAYVLTADSAFLFYDHVHKGTVFDFLHKNLGGATLDWQSRYNIALGIAQGIAFLHGCGDPVLLLDLSTKTVVLNSANEPQIADIELSKVIDPSKSTGSLSTVAGSVGYIPPGCTKEYAYTMRVTMAGNIYSFGVVLLELLTGKPSVSEGTELTKLVMSNSTRNDAREQILDPTISKTSLAVRSRMLLVLKIAQACVSISPEARPKIKNVVRMLLNAR
ncbi:hypothetical protein ACLOJK_001087 [Asimina triloba]